MQSISSLEDMKLFALDILFRQLLTVAVAGDLVAVVYICGVLVLQVEESGGTPAFVDLDQRGGKA
jgi:hypothetical protein